MRGHFFNIVDIYFIWPNEIDDPVVRYKGKEVNGYLLEAYLDDLYDKMKPEEEFYDWVHNNPQYSYDYILKRGR